MDGRPREGDGEAILSILKEQGAMNGCGGGSFWKRGVGSELI